MCGLAEQNYFCRKDESVPGVWLQVLTQRLHIHDIMCAGHRYDNMEEIAIQLGWTLQGQITARSQSGSSNGDRVPGGVVTKVGECSCRYNEDIREHATVRSMHREDIRIENKQNQNLSHVHRMRADMRQQP